MYKTPGRHMCMVISGHKDPLPHQSQMMAHIRFPTMQISLVGYMGFRAKTPVLTSSGGNKFLKVLVSEAMKTPLTDTRWNLLSWNNVFALGWFCGETETFILNNVVAAMFKFCGYVIKYLIDSILINQWKALFQHCSLLAIETCVALGLPVGLLPLSVPSVGKLTHTLMNSNKMPPRIVRKSETRLMHRVVFNHVIARKVCDQAKHKALTDIRDV